MQLVKATVVVLTSVAQSVRIRTDNGPGTSASCPKVAPRHLPGVGLVKFRDDGRIVEADASTPSAKEAARYYDRGIGSWSIRRAGLPAAPSPGLAFPGASSHNPAPCGGGLAIALGAEKEVEVECLLSDYETRRPHPSYPQVVRIVEEVQ